MRVTAAFFVSLVAATTSASSQEPAQAPPSFEVASIKVNDSGQEKTFWNIGPSPLITITNASLRWIIAHAFGIDPGVERFKLEGGPERILSTHFDITAKRPDGTSADQNLAMMRTLLAERFALRSRLETRQAPVYALSLIRQGTLGRQLAPSTYDCMDLRANRRAPTDPIAGGGVCFKGYDFGPDGAMTVRYSGPLAELIRRIQGFVDRPVVDATGLSGLFEWQLTFAIRENLEVPGVVTALREQLGLKLEPRTGPVEVLVIDSVQMPTPN